VPAEPGRIALVKLSSLGDVVHALPVAATLRAAFPGAYLAWLAERREAALLRGHPALDAVIPVDTRAWRRARTPRAALAAAGAVTELARHLRGGAFDVAIDLQGLVKSGVLTAATRAPLRIGFAAAACRERPAAWFTTTRVAPPADRHVVEQYLALLGPLGVGAPRLEWALPSEAAAEARVEEWLGAAGLKPRRRLVVLNPGAGRAAKRWPPERFGALARRLGDEAGAAALVVWGPGEEDTARTLVTHAGGGAALAPPTDLSALLAVLRRASVVVAADTGPLHLAAALGTPCVGLYGPTRAARNGPWGAGHAALEGAGGEVAAIGVEAVLEAVLERLQ
jgi:lipopolysaccharide heptosyltransferase I